MGDDIIIQSLVRGLRKCTHNRVRYLFCVQSFLWYTQEDPHCQYLNWS